MPKQTFEIELPEPQAPPPPDLSVHPVVSEMRERLARLEERTSSDGVDPAAAEALRLAGEASVAANAAREAAEKALQAVEKSAPSSGVVELPPTPSLPLTDPTPEETNQEHHHPWWHPMSWL